jgi:hypothetical protein
MPRQALHLLVVDACIEGLAKTIGVNDQVWPVDEG